MNMTEDSISDSEDKTIEIAQSKKKSEKKNWQEKRTTKSLENLWDNYTKSNICITE